MMVSVLICTYKREYLLAKALDSLYKTSPETPSEIIIVNGGDHKADGIIASFIRQGGIKIKVIKTTNKNLAASRNIGLPHCSGEIIAMTDDDAQVFPDWISQMKRLHAEHPEAGAIGGPVIGTNTDSLVGKVADAITFPGWSEAQYVRTLPGVNISYKREAVEKIGLQDETLFRGEDVDYNWRLLKLGYKVLFDPTVKVYHYHRPTVKGFLHQHYMYGRAYYLVRKKWPEMYCVYPHRIHSLRDILKAGNFIASIFYQPFLNAQKINPLRDRLSAIPLLFTAGISWKTGMARQAMVVKHTR